MGHYVKCNNFGYYVKTSTLGVATVYSGYCSNVATVAFKGNKMAQAKQYVIGKPYSPRKGTAQNNMRSWALVQQALVGQPNGLTLAQLNKAVAVHNHAPFIKYLIARGWLIAAQ